VFERFTDTARKVVVYAQEECLRLHHDRIGTEHVLLGLLRDGGIVAQSLQAVGVSLARARVELERTRGKPEHPPVGQVPFTPRAKQALEHSLRVAQRLGQEHIGRPTMLRGLLDVPDCTAVQTLRGLGVDLGRLAAVADELVLAEGTVLAAQAAGSALAEPPGPGSSGRGLHQTAEGLLAEAQRLADQRDRLARGLRRYGRHLEGCDPDRGCSCGLGPLLDLGAQQ
jgi:ATP-dependent Clp protease ATP-binding subunit ClpC